MLWIFIRDLRNRLFCKPWKWGLLLGITALLILRAGSGFALAQTGEGPSAGDLFSMLFLGIPTYVRIDGVPFILPFGWLTLLLGFTMPATNLVTRELSSTGITTLLQAGRRGRWLFSRYLLAAAVSVLSFSGVLLLCGIGACLCGGSLSLYPTELLRRVAMAELPLTDSVVFLYLMPFAAIFTLLFMQLTAEILTNSIMAVILSLFIEVLSCYYTTPFLPGNGAILLRGVLFERRIRPPRFLAVCAVFCLACLLIGRRGFAKKDLLSLGRE